MYDSTKAAQVVAYFALQVPSRTINVLKATKLLYLADREALKSLGLPLLNEPRVSMRNGPVNSWTYDRMSGSVEDPKWSAVLDARENHLIGVKPGVTLHDMTHLSPAEIAVLDAIWTRFGGMNQWQLAAWTHRPDNVPEWEDPGDGASVIPLERLVRAVGIADVSGHVSWLEEQEALDDVLAALA